MIRTMRRAVTGCAALTIALLAAAPPAQAATYSRQTIPNNGTWYSYGSPTVNHFRSYAIPWGVLHTDSNGRQTVKRIGAKTMWVRWTLVGVGYSGILVAASEEDQHYMDRLVVGGVFSDGPPNTGAGNTGAGNLIAACTERTETVIPAFVGAGPGPFCARYDHAHSHHNMTTQFSWELNNYGGGYWWCYVRSTVSYQAANWVHYWFTNPVTLRIAGAAGPFYNQGHMNCGSTVLNGFSQPAGGASDRGYVGVGAERAAVKAAAAHNAGLR